MENEIAMENLCIRIPKRLQEGLKLKAQEKNIKMSEIIRDALWKIIEVAEADSYLYKAKNHNNNARKNALEEQIYFTRCLVEHIGLIIEDGGQSFIDKCHLKKEQLLKSIRK